jgi:hypothetical protein
VLRVCKRVPRVGANLMAAFLISTAFVVFSNFDTLLSLQMYNSELVQALFLLSAIPFSIFALVAAILSSCPCGKCKRFSIPPQHEKTFEEQNLEKHSLHLFEPSFELELEPSKRVRGETVFSALELE